MTPKVPMRESGTATLGMMVAQTFRRNAKTTKITRIMEMTSATSTSCTEARMVVVLSMAMPRWMEGEMEARSTGRRAVTRSEEHTSELQSHLNLVCRLLLEKKN